MQSACSQLVSVLNSEQGDEEDWGGGKRRRRNCAVWVRAVIYFSNGFFTDFFIAKAQLKPHFACFAAFFCKFFIGLVLPAVRTPSQCTHARTHTRTHT